MTYEQFQQRYRYNPNSDILGQGGFGSVYKAYDTYRDIWVAIKKAEVKNEYKSLRLKNEVDLVNNLPLHPNIAYYSKCYSYTFAGITYDFAVLQYYQLGNLQQLAENYPLSFAQKENILFQLLDGIEFLHTQNVIQRDLKPGNILMVDRDGNYIPKITDFGISKKTTSNTNFSFENSILGVGTFNYSSPEQLLNDKIDKNADLWSFGVIACWLLTGKLPFNVGTYESFSQGGRSELFKQIKKVKLPSFVGDIPQPWQLLIKRCLVTDPTQRIKNVAECRIVLGLLEPQYYEQSTESSNSYRKLIRNKKYGDYGFIDENTQEEVISYKYTDAADFSEGLAAVKRYGKWGFIDENENLVIPFMYDDAASFFEERAQVELNGKCGFINKKGIQVIPLIYNKVYRFSGGKAG